MADPYYTGGSVSADPYYSGGSGSNADPYYSGSSGSKGGKVNINLGGGGGHHTWNVVGSLEDAATGFVPGVYHLLTNPAKYVPLLAKSEYNYWRPFVSGYKDLLTGNVAGYERGKKEYEHGVHQNPIGLTDLLFGVGAVAGRGLALGRLAELSRAGEAISPARVRTAALTGRNTDTLRTIGARGAKGGETIPIRTLPPSAYRASRMVATDALMKKYIPENFPTVGEFARGARAAKRKDRVGYLRAISSAQKHEYDLAFSRLNHRERAVFGAVARLPLAKDLQAWKEMLTVTNTPEAKQTLSILEDPKVMRIYNQIKPGDKMWNALEKGRALSETRQQILEHSNVFEDGEAQIAPYRHIRMARGAEILTKGLAYRNLRAINAGLTSVAGSKGRLVRQGRKAGQDELKSAIKEGTDASIVAIRSSKKRAQLRSFADQVSQRATDVAALRDMVDKAAHGEVDLNSLGIPSPYFAGLSELPKRFASQTLDQRIHQLSQTGLNDKLAAQIAASERKITQLRKRTDKRGQQMHVNQLTKLERLKAKAAEPTGTSTHELTGQRLQVLGKLHDKLEPAYMAYEKALAAEYGMERESLTALEAAEKQAASKVAVGQAREARMKILQGQREKFADLLETQQGLMELAREIEDTKGKLFGGGSWKDIKAEIDAAGRPQPFYLPDVAAEKQKGRLSTPEGSIAAQRWRADVYNSRGILFRTGMLALHADVLGPSFLRAAKHDYYVDLHNTAKKLAVEVPRGHGLPVGMVWVRKRRGEKIPYTETHRHEHMKEAADVYGHDLSEEEKLTGNIDTPEGEIQLRNKNRLAISSAYAKEFEADFKRSSLMVKRFVEGPMTVWRSLILHLRVPWLVNNILGNAMLTTLRFMGIDGLKALASMIYETRGAQGIREMLGDQATFQNLTKEDIQKVLPEQLRGTGIETQLPTSAFSSYPKVGNALNESTRLTVKGTKAAVGVLPSLDRRTEQAMRRFSSNVVLRGSPEVRALYKAMPKQTRSWRDASLQAMEANPALRHLVVKEVNDALGDFLSLSRKERTAVRQLIPFYAWFREITRIAAHTLINTPGRAALLISIGQVGSESIPQDVPHYLKGAIPYGKTESGLTKAVSLHSLSPFTTVSDEARSLGSLFPGSTEFQRRDFASNFNPLVAGLASQFSLGKSKYGLPGTALLSTIQGLPQVRVITNNPSALYPERTQLDQLLRLLGDQRIKYDPSVAAFQASQGK